jgi:hypothetical protein
LASWLARLAKVFRPLIVSVVVVIIYDSGFFAAAQALLVVKEMLDRHRSVFVLCLIGCVVSAWCNYPVAAPNENETANNYHEVEHFGQAAIVHDQDVEPAIVAAVHNAPDVNPPAPEEPLPTAGAAAADAAGARSMEDAAINDDIMDAAALASAVPPENTIDNEQQQELNDPLVIASPTAVNLPPQMAHSRSVVAPQPRPLQSVQPFQLTNANPSNGTATNIPQGITRTRYSRHAGIATRSMLSNVARMPVPPPPSIGPLRLRSATARGKRVESTDDEEDKDDSQVEDNLKEDYETGAEDETEEYVPSSTPTSRKRHGGAHEGGLAKRTRSGARSTATACNKRHVMPTQRQVSKRKGRKQTISRKKEETWQDRFQELLQYREENGDCNVPRDYENKVLANWVKSQRFRRHNLSEKRLKLLNEISFDWNRPDTAWDVKYEELFEFLKTQGMPPCNSKLGYWIRNQRMAFCGNRGFQALSPARIDKFGLLPLQIVGFPPIHEAMGTKTSGMS